MYYFLTALSIVFITLKLAAIGVVATWPWWLVLLPLYAIPLIALSIFLFVFIVGVIGAAVVDSSSKNKYRKR